MAKQFNPFNKWLGFDDKVTHPNHFQLFDVKPNSEDPIGFRKQIHSQAKIMLAKLEIMPDEEVGERKALHTKLRRYIVKAHETMLDDKLRAAYKKGLRQKVREAKGSKPLAVPPPQMGNVAQAASQTSKQQATQTMKGSSTPTIKQKADEVRPEVAPIPMAIPLSKPGQHEMEEIESNASDEVSFDNPKSEQIVIKPGRIKRKRSWLIPVLCLLMTLLCVAGISALMTSFGNKFENNPTPKVDNRPAEKVTANSETQDDAPKPEEND